MKITKLHALTVRIPQHPPIAPYQSRYRATSVKEALVIRLETDTGHVGWGETPIDWLSKSFQGTPEEPLRKQALGRDPFDIEGWYANAQLHARQRLHLLRPRRRHHHAPAQDRTRLHERAGGTRSGRKRRREEAGEISGHVGDYGMSLLALPPVADAPGSS